MIKKNKILLPTEDVITRGEEDLFIDLNLDRHYSEIAPSEYQNNFDIQKQFDKERNESRDFCIYGQVSSIDVDTSDIELDVYIPLNNIGNIRNNSTIISFTEKEFIELSDGTILTYKSTVKTNPLTYLNKGIFGYNKGYYKIDLKNFNKDSVFFTFIKGESKILNENSEFALGLEGWFTMVSEEYANWTVDRSDNSIKANKVQSSNGTSGVRIANSINSLSDYNAFRISCTIEVQTKSDVTFYMFGVDELTVPPTNRFEIDYVVGDLSSNYGFTFIFSDNEDENSFVKVHNFRIIPVANDSVTINRLRNNKFLSGLDFWNQGSGDFVWRPNTSTKEVVVSKNVNINRRSSSSVLYQQYNTSTQQEYIFALEFGRNNEDVNFEVYLGDNNDLQQFLIFSSFEDTTKHGIVSKNFVPDANYSTISITSYFNEDSQINSIFSLKEVFLYQKTNNSIVNNQEIQLFRKPIVFYDENSNVIEYGNETVNSDFNGNVTVVENDFPFFYNIHWVKNNIEIFRNLTRNVYLSPSSTLEIEEGELIKFSVILDRPSLSGTEEVLVNISSSNINRGTGFDITKELVSFEKGQQTQDFYLTTNTRVGFNDTGRVNLNLSDVNGVNVIEPNSATVIVNNKKESKFANISIKNIFNNLISFGKRVGTINNEQVIEESAHKSIFRNGFYFDGIPEEFYPTGLINLKITNLGQDTTLEPNAGIIDEPIELLNNESYSTTLSISYPENQLRHQFILSIQKPVGAVSAAIDINGHIFTDINTIVDLLVEDAADNTEKTYEISALNENELLIESNYNGVPVVINTFDPSGIINLQEERSFSYIEQNPFNLTLKGNESNGDILNYEIEISKPGFKSIIINTTGAEAKLDNFNVYHLVSTYTNMLNFIDNGNCIPVDNVPVAGDIKLNGVLLLSDNIDEFQEDLNETISVDHQLLLNEAIIKPCTLETSNFNKLTGYNN